MNAVLRRSLAPLLLVATAAWACGLTRMAHEWIAHAATATHVHHHHDDHRPAHDDDHGDCAACQLLSGPLASWSTTGHPVTPDRPAGTPLVIDDQPHSRTAASALPPARAPPATA